MTKIPAYIFRTFGEFIVQHNIMDAKMKKFLAAFVDTEDIGTGYLLTANQNFEFIKKRVNAIFLHIIEEQELVARWKNLQGDIKKINEVRNDIAHSLIDLEPENRRMFVLFRYTENTVLKLSHKATLYNYSELRDLVSKLKGINRKLSFLFHTTYKRHFDFITTGRELIF